MFKKAYERPKLILKSFCDVIVMSTLDGFNSNEWDNSTIGEIEI